eukprot:569183-Prymnesium_polylepis.1
MEYGLFFLPLARSLAPHGPIEAVLAASPRARSEVGSGKEDPYSRPAILTRISCLPGVSPARKPPSGERRRRAPPRTLRGSSHKIIHQVVTTSPPRATPSRGM